MAGFPEMYLITTKLFTKCNLEMHKSNIVMIRCIYVQHLKSSAHSWDKSVLKSVCPSKEVHEISFSSLAVVGKVSWRQ